MLSPSIDVWEAGPLGRVGEAGRAGEQTIKTKLAADHPETPTGISNLEREKEEEERRKKKGGRNGKRNGRRKEGEKKKEKEEENGGGGEVALKYNSLWLIKTLLE